MHLKRAEDLLNRIASNKKLRFGLAWPEFVLAFSLLVHCESVRAAAVLSAVFMLFLDSTYDMCHVQLSNIDFFLPFIDSFLQFGVKTVTTPSSDVTLYYHTIMNTATSL